MMIAQQLYEGVELGSEGSVALITYMRTDSTRVSDDALKACRDHIDDRYGDAVPAGEAEPLSPPARVPRRPTRRSGRPTWRTRRSGSAALVCRSEQLRLYTLIYNRFVASQMTPAVFAVTNVEVSRRAAGRCSRPRARS